MIVLSDEEDEVEEIQPDEKMEKESSPGDKEKPFVIDDLDDVRVVGEVSYQKHPRGVVLGPPRRHDPYGLHVSNIRRRKRTETNSSVKYVTIRRNINSSSLRNMCSSVVRRKLFCVGEAVRLEEKKKYMQLIQAIIGYEMIAASYVILRHFMNFFTPHIWQVLQNCQSQRIPPPVQSHNTPTRRTIRTKPPTVECVDLDSDSDNDVVEFPQESKASKGGEQMNNIDEIDEIDLEQETEKPCSLLQSFSEHGPEIENKASTSSAQFKRIPDADQMYINLVDDDEEEEEEEEVNLVGDEEEEEEVNLVDDEEEEDSDNVIAVPSPTENRPNLADQMIQQMSINDHVETEKLGEEDEEEAGADDLEESLPEITSEMQVLVHEAFTSRPGKLLVNAFNITIHGRDIQTLKGNNWLNDQVINFYMTLLTERGKLGSYPSVYCFNTFFFVKLVSSGHASLKRWTRMVDVFTYDMLIIPIHMKVHWCLAAVNFIEKKIEYYDSMRDNNNNNDCGQTLLRYLQDEHLDKKKKEFCTTGWEIVNLKDIPEQLNGCDCGVFACTYAEYICRLAKLKFTQEYMQYFRIKMAYEILTKKLLL